MKGDVIVAVTAPTHISAKSRRLEDESPRLISGLTRIVRDIGIAGDLAQDALIAALGSGRSQAFPTFRQALADGEPRASCMDHFPAEPPGFDRKHEELRRELAAKERAVPIWILLSIRCRR